MSNLQILLVLLVVPLLGVVFAASPNGSGSDGFVEVPAGVFRMGDDEADRDRWEERPAHDVTISNAYRMARQPVTEAEFQAFRPEYRTTPGMEPWATGISWNDAVAYCAWRSEQDGVPYRLPTEAEWEHAANQASRLGLEQMVGVPLEWCHDVFAEYPDHPEVDPTGPTEGLTRVVRGGPLDNAGVRAYRKDWNRSTTRASMAPDFGPFESDPIVQTEEDSSEGLYGTWFAGEDLTRPRQRDRVTRLDQNWINDIYRGSGWSARWRGQLEGPFTGPVTIRLSASTAARLRLAGDVVIDLWEQGGDGEATIDMVKGKKIPIEIDYARRGTRQTFLKGTWSWPGAAPTTIAGQSLSHEEAARRAAVADGGGSDVHPGFHQVGFRLVQAPMPAGSVRAAAEPYASQAVGQRSPHLTAAPVETEPYLRKRRLLPTPLDNRPGTEIDQLALHPSFRGHNHSPALEVCPNGDLLFVTYTSYGEYEPGVSFIASRLRHGADTWDFPSPFIDFLGANDHAPMLWTHNDTGMMYFAWGCPRLPGGYPFQWTVSLDSGATWTPVRFPRFVGPIGAHSRQPINTAVLDLAGHFYLPSDGNGGESVLWKTPDQGNTWYDTGGRSAGRHTTYALLDDGMGIIGMGGKNTDIDGFMPKAISQDGGRTWKVSKTPFPAQGTNQRPCLIRLDSGALCFAADWQHFRGMKPEGIDKGGSFVAVSDDQGETWTVRTLPGAQQHEDPQRHNGDATLGYSVMRQAPNGLIHLVATMNRPVLHFTFNEAWIRAGEQAGPIPSESGLLANTATSVENPASWEETLADGTRLSMSGGVADDGRFLLHGPCTWTRADGTPLRTATYRVGRLTGEEIFHGLDGSPRERRTHREEDGVAVFDRELLGPGGDVLHFSTWRNHAADGQVSDRRSVAAPVNATYRDGQSAK